MNSQPVFVRAITFQWKLVIKTIFTIFFYSFTNFLPLKLEIISLASFSMGKRKRNGNMINFLVCLLFFIRVCRFGNQFRSMILMFEYLIIILMNLNKSRKFLLYQKNNCCMYVTINTIKKRTN